MKKIFEISAQQQAAYPEIETVCLPEMGMHPTLFRVMREREIETQLGQVQMNCEMCKFRLAANQGNAAAGHGHGHHGHGHEHGHGYGHEHEHGHAHEHGHGHGHEHSQEDPYADPQKYHERAWQVP